MQFVLYRFHREQSRVELLVRSIEYYNQSLYLKVYCENIVMQYIECS